MSIERRAFLLSSLSLFAAAASAQSPNPPPSPFTGDPGAPSWPPRESFPLWPGAAPGQPAVLPKPNWTMNGPRSYRELYIEGVARPELHVFRPDKPSGQGLLVIPGGGYHFLAVQNEGIDAARAFTPHGVTVFVLTYRLPTEGWADRQNVPLQDAQRAMRLLRSRAHHFGIDPTTLGTVGFSAGGHLAASLATAHAEAVYRAVDEADRQSARPAFAGLIYPVIAMRPPLAHMGSREGLLGETPTEAVIDARSPQLRAGADTPPCFLAHAIDDGLVPYGNSVAMMEALHANGVAAELHLFEKGGHGFGFHLPSTLTGSRWPDLFRIWMGAHGTAA